MEQNTEFSNHNKASQPNSQLNILLKKKANCRKSHYSWYTLLN